MRLGVESWAQLGPLQEGVAQGPQSWATLGFCSDGGRQANPEMLGGIQGDLMRTGSSQVHCTVQLCCQPGLCHFFLVPQRPHPSSKPSLQAALKCKSIADTTRDPSIPEVPILPLPMKAGPSRFSILSFCFPAGETSRETSRSPPAPWLWVSGRFTAGRGGSWGVAAPCSLQRLGLAQHTHSWACEKNRI